MDVNVIVNVIGNVDVADAVIVAALVSGNDPVDVTDTGNDLSFVPGVGYEHGVVPVHERGHDHGFDHVHVPDHDHLHDQEAA